MYSNVASDGSFMIGELPPGKYALRSVTTIPQYTPTYTWLTVSAASPDTVRDTISLVYTGIPVVSNLKASYDTLDGIVTLTWDTVSYFLLNDFLIYRDQGQILTPSTTAIGTTSKCLFADTIGNLVSGSSTLFTYRVAVRSKDFSIGQTFDGVQVTGLPPVSVYLRDTLPVFLGVPHTIAAALLGNAGSAVVKYAWDIGGKGVFSQTQLPETTIVMHDSIVSSLTCVLKTTIGNAKTILDTVQLPVFLQWQKIASEFDISADSTASFHAVVLSGKLISFEVKHNNSNSQHKISVWQSTDAQNWSKTTDSLPILYSAETSKPVVFQNRICLVDDSAHLWTSTDGIAWIKTAGNPLCNTLSKFSGDVITYDSVCAPSLFVDENTLFLQPCQGTGSTKLLTSTDLMNWDSTTNYQIRSLVSTYTENNGVFVAVGYDWTANSQVGGIWLGIKTGSGIAYSRTPEPYSGGSNDPYTYNLVTYENKVLYSSSFWTNGLWALENNSVSNWFECSAGLPGLTNSDYSLVVFNNALFIISYLGVYKATN
jgi:hypothetical protein